VSGSPVPTVNQPTTLTVHVLTQAHTPIVQAQVQIDGAAVGTTDQTGLVTVPNYVFTTAGPHPVTAVVTTQADAYPDGQGTIDVQGYAYQVTASPSPIPVGKTIPQLTITATQANNQVVAGTFTITGANTTTLTSGAATNNVLISPVTKTVTTIGGTGKPISTTVSICPTVTFQPADQHYHTGSYSQLLACTGLGPAG
jgi:hypothetical protein